MLSYEKKVEAAISLLKSIPQDGIIELAYSGGKDSDVILELAKMAGIPFEAVYHKTTVDPPGTTRHCQDAGATILSPATTLLKEIEKHGQPTRRARWCCRQFKEKKYRDRAIWGIRRSESRDRAERYKEPEICRVYGKGEKARVYLPILEWTDEDVERFIAERGIRCHPLYYDSEGAFHVERRLGCIGCPMSRSGRIADFKRYPKMLKLWVEATDKWLKAHPDSEAARRFGNVYNLTYANIFSRSMKDYEDRMNIPIIPVGCEDGAAWRDRYFGRNWRPGCGRTLNTKLFLEDEFGIKFAV